MIIKFRNSNKGRLLDLYTMGRWHVSEKRRNL